MQRFRHRLVIAAIAAQVAVLLALAPAALAVPGASGTTAPAPGPATSTVEQKKAERQGALADLERKRVEFSDKLSEYATLGRRIEQTRGEMAEAASQTAELDSQLATQQAALSKRCVELYQRADLSMLELLMTSRSAQEFLVRAEYLTVVSDRDALLLDDVRKLRSEKLYLQRSLDDRLQRLQAYLAAADQQRDQILADIAGLESKAKELGTTIAALEEEQKRAAEATATGSAPTTGWNQDAVISDTNFNAASSLDAKAIQEKLDGYAGTLKTYRGPDYLGRTKTAAEMIAEAAAAWQVSPKVILVTLQKEQSLLEKRSPTQEAYDWAMGCGKADSRTYMEYKGFGKQIYWGAQKLRKNANLWSPGATQDIDGTTVHPVNPGTHAQYRYTPHFRGVISFWTLYWKYFGDPLGG